MNKPTANCDHPAVPAEPMINISCYKFVRLDNLTELRSAISAQAERCQLRGTVLLSEEGINLFVAGKRASIDAFVEFLKSDDRLADIAPKESASDYQPFNRMLVKIKKEIIAFGVESVDPVEKTSEKLPAAQLQRWLDEGRRVHLLDVRNDYEYDIGTFDDAIRLGLDHFREFPDAVEKLPESMKDEPIVMFCTGGIRCEKAGPYMEQAGFHNVYQLDGGILKYFEEVGGDHYHGECFVFDQRVAVDPALNETETTQCYVCQAVVTPEEQQLDSYVAGQSCPHCIQDEGERLKRRLQQREKEWREAAAPLPGSVPYENIRPLNVPQRFDGRVLLDFLDEWHPQVGRSVWADRIAEQRIVPAPRNQRRKRRRKQPTEPLPLAPDRVVRGGERFHHLQPGMQEPDVCVDVTVLYEDNDLIAISKPAPLPMHPCGRFNRNTLRYLLNEVYHPERPHVVHRLDANTSGVVLLCRRKSVARMIQAQFQQQQVQKTYLARIHGHPDRQEFVCEQAISAQPADRGIRVTDADGLPAITRFRVLAAYKDGTSLVEAVPVTGRTNQIRIHLWSCGHPIVGDPAYLQEQQLGSNSTLQVDAPPMCLHALRMRLTDHLGQKRTFETSLPDWIPDEKA